MNSWDKYFLDICNVVAQNTKCFSRGVGAIIVVDKAIVSEGYNGPPRGVPQCDQRWLGDKCLENELVGKTWPTIENRLGKCPRKVLSYPSGYGLHLCMAAHAERNALINAARLGIAVKGATMYMNCGIPCKECLIEIINAGISEIVCTDYDYYDDASEWLLTKSEVKMRAYKL